MTIDNVGARADHYSYATENFALGTEAQLAIMILENEEAQKECDRERRDLALRDFIQASEVEVAAMREEAQDIRVGALFQAGATVTAASIQLTDLCDDPDVGCKELPVCEILGGTAKGLSEPLGNFLGAAAAASDRADAKAAAGDAQQAEWQLAELKENLREAEGQQQKVTDWLSALIDKDAAAMNAVLSNMA